MIEHKNIIDCLVDQIDSLLDLMSMAGTSTDMKSVNIAASMCLTMMDEVMIEVDKIVKEWRAANE